MAVPTLLAFALLQLVLGPCVLATYTPPQALVEPLIPTGIRISVPHEDGITLVAVHAKINDDFYTLEAGTISQDIKLKNGRWVYEDRTTKLRYGDVVYYWIHADYKGEGYNLLNQEYRVSRFYPTDESKADLKDILIFN